ncbi:CpsD/CapB family tyrosine-protein kinase [Clostridium sp. SYSU_GA19001]|uniref:CpsD/CapB family tyrosine-protein kinase n=1 Tax=Clostridium caldaquaticum TaxID=2940653 RepID=UPI0020772CA9|nr:CpsD/CapB family tyrosine-protein kinase [Clostridium caldaquaticum]MCM8711384.1 CpsD/CapB family tyrosine-protein kinase [Clostridium caldaquaticum]
MHNEMISIKNPKSAAAEAFRTLRTNIQFSSLDEELKTIVVTSTQPGEGKSTVVSNLAITMAQTGKKVLLIDCDLRKPTIHKKLGISNQDGLTSLLSKEKSAEEVIKASSIPNFYVLTSGPIPPNPAELLGSKRFKALIKELGEVFNVILLDAPPVLAVTDAQLLSTFCSGVVFVAGYGQAEKHAIVRAKELIDKVGGKILGVVINKIPAKSKSYYYYSYDYK